MTPLVKLGATGCVVLAYVPEPPRMLGYGYGRMTGVRSHDEVIAGGTKLSAAPSVADMVLRTLSEAGSGTVFGLPGTHNLAFWRGPSGRGAPRLVNVRHEQTAVYAADGWARASGRLGAALVTTGPGAANAVAAFGEAAMSGTPLVLVASEVPLYLAVARVQRSLHQSRDQAGMFKPLAKAVFTPRSPQAVAQDLGAAIATALSSPRGPVYVDIPADVLTAPASLFSAPSRLAPVAVDANSLDEAAALINSSRSIAIWAGGGVVQAEAERALSGLAAHLQAPVFTTFSSRGALGGTDPANVDLPPHEPEIEEMLASAEVLLAVGTDFDGIMTKNAKLRLPRTIIDINTDMARTSFGYEGVVPVLADAKVAMEALLQVTKRRSDGLISALPAVKERVWTRLRSDARTREACTFVGSVERAATGAVVVNDMTIPGYWLANYYRPNRTRALHCPLGWGTLGFALPASVGAAFAGEGPVLAVCGDGGFMFAVGELATIAQERLAITVLVVNDNGYGMLRYGRQDTGLADPAADLVTPDFVKVAEAFGIGATQVTGVGPALEGALGEALAGGVPRMVVCDASLFPPRTTSPRWHEVA